MPCLSKICSETIKWVDNHTTCDCRSGSCPPKVGGEMFPLRSRLKFQHLTLWPNWDLLTTVAMAMAATVALICYVWGVL